MGPVGVRCNEVRLKPRSSLWVARMVRRPRAEDDLADMASFLIFTLGDTKYPGVQGLGITRVARCGTKAQASGSVGGRRFSTVQIRVIITILYLSRRPNLRRVPEKAEECKDRQTQLHPYRSSVKAHEQRWLVGHDTEAM